MEQKSKILIIGATGNLGRLITETSARYGHQTFAFIRETAASDPEKSNTFESFKDLKVNIVYGDIYNHESLVSAIKQVDVVISVVGGAQVGDQVKIIEAIKEAGNIKRFMPSEFGHDVDRVEAVDPISSLYADKAKIRRVIESEKIPFTYVVSNLFAGYFLPKLGAGEFSAEDRPPRDKIVIFGDGNVKAIFVEEEDIAQYTIAAVDDPKTLNKILNIRPHDNILSFNEVVAKWEFKIGKTLEKKYVLEDELLKNIQDASMPLKLDLSIAHAVFVKGAAMKFQTDDSIAVEATQLYADDITYVTVDDYLNDFI